ncbi:MAG: hypothetical protein WD048_09245 [Chitinophagales bacterium]
MSALELKEELRLLIESEEDVEVLEALFTLLKKSKASVLKRKLSDRAKRSNQQIKNGAFLSREDMEEI